MVDGLLEDLFFGDHGSQKASAEKPKPAARPTATAGAQRPPGPRSSVSSPAQRPSGARPSIPHTRAPAPSDGERLGAWARIMLGVLFAAAMTQWPYARACGVGLTSYLGAVVLVIMVGVWCGTFSWRNRLVRAHLMSLGVVLWGLGLGMGQVLPRVGYANAAATFRCTASPQSPPPPQSPATSSRTNEQGG